MARHSSRLPLGLHTLHVRAADWPDRHMWLGGAGRVARHSDLVHTGRIRELGVVKSLLKRAAPECVLLARSMRLLRMGFTKTDGSTRGADGNYPGGGKEQPGWQMRILGRQMGPTCEADGYYSGADGSSYQGGRWELPGRWIGVIREVNRSCPRDKWELPVGG